MTSKAAIRNSDEHGKLFDRIEETRIENIGNIKDLQILITELPKRILDEVRAEFANKDHVQSIEKEVKLNSFYRIGVKVLISVVSLFGFSGIIFMYNIWQKIQ